MATWHQSRRPVRHWHPTQWVVLTDPPGGFASSMLFATEDDAKAFLARITELGRGRYSYILPPGGIKVTP